MTTIAYRDGVLAGDRRSNWSGTITITQKVFRRDDGALFGAAGAAVLRAAFCRWFLAGETGDRPTLRDKDETAQALIIRPTGAIEFHSAEGWCPQIDRFIAIGSGQDFALAAMEMGADAVKAVEIAARRDAYTGNGVDAVSLATHQEAGEPARALVAGYPDRFQPINWR